jgi:hypothetical protein
MKRFLLALALLPVSLAAHEKTETPQPKITANVASHEKVEAPQPKIAPKVLTALNAAVAFADVGYTASKAHRRDFVEYDPLAKPFVHHTPLSLGLAGGEVVGLQWLAGRMRRSERWHRVWWLPQTVAITAHAYALGTSVRNFSNTGNPSNSRLASDLYHPRITGGRK